MSATRYANGLCVLPARQDDGKQVPKSYQQFQFKASMWTFHKTAFLHLTGLSYGAAFGFEKVLMYSSWHADQQAVSEVRQVCHCGDLGEALQVTAFPPARRRQCIFDWINTLYSMQSLASDIALTATMKQAIGLFRFRSGAGSYSSVHVALRTAHVNKMSNMSTNQAVQLTFFY